MVGANWLCDRPGLNFAGLLSVRSRAGYIAEAKSGEGQSQGESSVVQQSALPHELLPERTIYSALGADHCHSRLQIDPVQA